jgi:hypothetical protein
VGNSHKTRKLTAKDAKDAKETTIEELRVFIENSVLGSAIFASRKQLPYFAPFASFAVRLYKAQMTHSIRGRIH